MVILKITINKNQAGHFIQNILQLEGVFLEDITRIENNILTIKISAYKTKQDFIKEVEEIEKFENVKYNNLTILKIGG